MVTQRLLGTNSQTRLQTPYQILVTGKRSLKSEVRLYINNYVPTAQL